ncbi:MAG: Rpn family recombination-promoting nuclease/putative transposase [Bacteroidota bacterium]
MHARKRNQPHDRVYKGIMAEPRIARPFLEKHMDPEVKDRVDFSTLQITDPSSLGQDYKQLYADVVYKALTKDTRREIFLVLNHERNPCLFLPIRILEYILGTVRKMFKLGPRKPAFAYHITLYNGRAKAYPYPKSIGEFFDEEDRALAQRLLLSSHKVVNLHDYTDDELSAQGEIGVFQLVLKHGSEPYFLSWLEQRPDLAHKIATDRNSDQLITYITEVSHKEPEEIRRIFADVSSKLESNMLTTAEQIRRVGIKEGVERGKKEGREEGKEEIFAHMLRAHVPEMQISFFTGLDHAKITEIAARMN